MNDNIYNLKLHDKCIISENGMGIMRVSGGWIYELAESSHVFVPFNEHDIALNICKECAKHEKDFSILGFCERCNKH